MKPKIEMSFPMSAMLTPATPVPISRDPHSNAALVGFLPHGYVLTSTGDEQSPSTNEWIFVPPMGFVQRSAMASEVKIEMPPSSVHISQSPTQLPGEHQRLFQLSRSYASAAEPPKPLRIGELLKSFDDATDALGLRDNAGFVPTTSTTSLQHPTSAVVGGRACAPALPTGQMRQRLGSGASGTVVTGRMDLASPLFNISSNCSAIDAEEAPGSPTWTLPAGWSPPSSFSATPSRLMSSPNTTRTSGMSSASSTGALGGLPAHPAVVNASQLLAKLCARPSLDTEPLPQVIESAMAPLSTFTINNNFNLSGGVEELDHDGTIEAMLQDVPVAVKVVRVPLDANSSKYVALKREIEVMDQLCRPLLLSSLDPGTPRPHPHIVGYVGTFALHAYDETSTTAPTPLQRTVVKSSKITSLNSETTTITVGTSHVPVSSQLEGELPASLRGSTVRSAAKKRRQKEKQAEAKEDPPTVGIVLELMNCGSLSSVLDGRKRASLQRFNSRDAAMREAALRPREAIAITAAIASALHFMVSRHGLVHRDVKPANILLDVKLVNEDEWSSPSRLHHLGDWERRSCLSEPSVVLADFGIAESLSSARQCCGTKTYMAPEVYLGRDFCCGREPPSMDTCTSAEEFHRPMYDAAVDVWSLGVTLQAMLTASMDPAALRAHWIHPTTVQEKRNEKTPVRESFTRCDSPSPEEEAKQLIAEQLRQSGFEWHESADEEESLAEDMDGDAHNDDGPARVHQPRYKVPKCLADLITPECVAFVNRLVCVNPEQRLTAAGVLQDPFMVDCLVPELTTTESSSNRRLPTSFLPSDPQDPSAQRMLLPELHRQHTLLEAVEASIPRALGFIPWLFGGEGNNKKEGTPSSPQLQAPRSFVSNQSASSTNRALFTDRSSEIMGASASFPTDLRKSASSSIVVAMPRSAATNLSQRDVNNSSFLSLASGFLASSRYEADLEDSFPPLGFIIHDEEQPWQDLDDVNNDPTEEIDASSTVPHESASPRPLVITLESLGLKKVVIPTASTTAVDDESLSIVTTHQKEDQEQHSSGVPPGPTAVFGDKAGATAPADTPAVQSGLASSVDQLPSTPSGNEGTGTCFSIG